MLKTYQEFKLVKENLQQARRILSNLNLNYDHPDFITLQQMFKNNPSYLVWFTRLRFEQDITIEQIEEIWKLIKTNKSIVSSMSTPVVQTKNIEEFKKIFHEAEIKQKVSSIFRKIPPHQAKFFDLNKQEDLKLMIDLASDPDKENWFKNLRKYPTEESLRNSLENFLYKKAPKQFEGIISELRDLNVNIVHADKAENIILTIVDYQQLIKLAHECGWCILVKSDFDRYNNEKSSKQWLIFLTDQTGPYSKIATTTFIAPNMKIRHVDCRLSGDIILPINDLYEMLESRKVDPSIFYNVMKNYFKSEDVNIDFISFKNLLTLGVSRHQILKRKKFFSKGDLEQLTDDEKKQIKPVLLNQQENSDKISTILDKFSQQQIEWLDLENSEDNYGLMLKLVQDKKRQSFFDNLAFLDENNLFLPALEKFILKKDEYNYETILKDLQSNNIKILQSDPETIIVKYDHDKLDKLAIKWNFNLISEFERDWKKEPRDKLAVRFMIFKPQMNDIYSRVYLQGTTMLSHLVSSQIRDWNWQFFFVSDIQRRMLLSDRILKDPERLFDHLDLNYNILNESMLDAMNNLSNWDAYGLQFLLDKQYTIDQILEKKQLFTTNDLSAKLNQVDKKTIEDLCQKSKSKLSEMFFEDLQRNLHRERMQLDNEGRKMVDEIISQATNLNSDKLMVLKSKLRSVDNLSLYDAVQTVIDYLNFWQKIK